MRLNHSQLAFDPLIADLCVFKAWGEDVEECMAALKKMFVKYKISYDTPLWFCVFSKCVLAAPLQLCSDVVAVAASNAKTAQDPPSHNS